MICIPLTFVSQNDCGWSCIQCVSFFTPDENGAPQTVKSDPDINISQAVDNTGIWKNMVRSYDAPLPSPHHKHRYRPTPLSPVIVEERESDLISPRTPRTPRTPPAPPAPVIAVSPPDTPAGNLYQVTAV